MNDALKMQISAFVDDELPENETELLLRRLSQDAALRRQAAEYLRLGRLIRREREVPGMGDLRKRIAAALGEQPVEAPAPAPASANKLLKPAAGIAVAASVAIVALVGLRQVEGPAGGDLTPVASSPATPAVEQAASYTEPAARDALPGNPGEILTQYYLSHGATSADLGANGILTRLVTLELREGELVEVSRAEEATAAEEPEESTGENPGAGNRQR